MATINGTFNSLIGGTISGQVGTPGPQGPAGPTGSQGPAGAPGVGVPAGGLTAQILSKASGTSYDTAWTTLSLTGYATESWVTAGFYPLTGNPSGFITSSALLPYLTSATAASTYQTLSGMTAYLTTASAASTYAPIAAGMPTSGTVGQVLTKQSGSSYDAAWATLIPGDRYLTSSTTSLTINNANKTLTIGTGLSYSSQQDIVITYNASNHMHARVLTYNSGTGVMTVDVLSHTGTGTFASWTVNVGGTVPLQSVEWGEILGVIGDQSDLATALNSKLEITDAESTYLPLAGGALDANASVTASDTSTETDSELAGWGLGVQLSADHTKGTTVEFNGLDTYDGELHMQVTPAGLTFPDTSVQITAGIPDAPSDGYTYGRVNGEWGVAPQVTNNSQLSTTVTTDASVYVYVGGSAFPRNSIIRMTYGADAYVTLQNPDVFVAGDQVLIVNQTSGYITFVDDGSCTVLSPAGLYCVTTNGVVAAVYLGDQVWVLSGNLQASI